MKPNSKEHAGARLGRITSSSIATIMFGTHVGLKALSNELKSGIAAELGAGNSQATAWGVANEPRARAVFIERNPDLNIGRSAFEVYSGSNQTFRKYCGASPDLVVYDEDDIIIGGAEIKCPWLQENHRVNALTKQVPSEYMPQVQYMMFVTGARWWRFVSYDPRLDREGEPGECFCYSEILVLPDPKFVRRMIDKLNFFIRHHENGGDFRVHDDPIIQLPDFF